MPDERERYAHPNLPGACQRIRFAIALKSTLAQLVLPWWSIALVAFAFCFGRRWVVAGLFSLVLWGLVWSGWFMHCFSMYRPAES